MTSDERVMLHAVPHRHTHRGAFEPGPLPGDLLIRLRDDAAAEGATLAVVEPGPAYRRLMRILAAWRRKRDLYPASHAEVLSQTEAQRWTREPGSQDRDGVPAYAFPATGGPFEPGHLPPRDFDLGRGWGFRPAGGQPAPVTAILVTPGDDQESWLHAGQALQRLLLRAASQWVFASLQTQPLLSAAVRAQIRSSLALPGAPQLLLELGMSRTSHATGRRPADELTAGRLWPHRPARLPRQRPHHRGAGLRTSPGNSCQVPAALARSMAAWPCSVICPSSVILAARCRFSRLHLLRAVRGVNRSCELFASRLRCRPSIHPKHSACSTASS
jgi:hypothetical protein